MQTLLQINTDANLGSTGRIAEQIGVLASNQGFRSYMAYGREINHSKLNIIKIGNSIDVHIHALKTRLFDNQGLNSKSVTKTFIECVRTINPDIIHLHNIHGYYLNYEILFNFLKEWRGPVVWTLHDLWPITGHCAYFGVNECSKWRSGCGDCPYLKYYPKSVFFDRSKSNWLQKKAAFTSLNNITLVPVSNWLSGIIEESFMKNYPKVTIHNGVDTSVFTTCDNIKQSYVLGVANIWEERKGLHDFFELRKLLHSSIGIKLVGLTKEQKASLPEGIEGIERTNSVTELNSLYANALALVNPTYEDNFPTVNIEALSCGTSVITYNTGGSPEAIDEQTGIVVDKGDVMGLVKAIEEIRNSCDKYTSLQCRSRAETFFNSSLQYEKYLELYKTLIK